MLSSTARRPSNVRSGAGRSRTRLRGKATRDTHQIRVSAYSALYLVALVPPEDRENYSKAAQPRQPKGRVRERSSGQPIKKVVSIEIKEKTVTMFEASRTAAETAPCTVRHAPGNGTQLSGTQ